MQCLSSQLDLQRSASHIALVYSQVFCQVFSQVFKKSLLSDFQRQSENIPCLPSHRSAAARMPQIAMTLSLWRCLCIELSTLT